jgi:hypothetical protein
VAHNVQFSDGKIAEGQDMTDFVVSGDDAAEQATDDLGDVEQVLRCRLGVRVRDLELRAEAHGLVIVGRTTSYYDKQLAQNIVHELCGRQVAENRISVDSPPHASSSKSATHRVLHRPHEGGSEELRRAAQWRRF